MSQLTVARGKAESRAAELGLSNLTAIVDVNRLEQSIATRIGWNMDRYAAQFEVFGWETLVIDGHDLPACVRAMAHASHGGGSKPLAILARTQKGAGVSFMADQDNWHGKPMDQAHADRALLELGVDDPTIVGKIAKPAGTPRRAPHIEQGLKPQMVKK